jgi:hypothetical protein
MPAIVLGRSDYARSEVTPLGLKNCYFEQAPTNLEDQVSIRARPRVTQFTTAGAGPINGLYRKGNVLANAGFSGQILCLSNNTLYRVHQTTGVATSIGTVAGTLRMSAEGTEDVVVLARGTTAYTCDGSALSAIVFPDSKNVYAIDYLAGYFLFCSELGRFYWSAVGGTTVDALDYATAESQPDTLLTLKVIGDELWLFGRTSIEPWQPTGDLDLPFQRIGGRIFGIGVTGRETVQKFSLQGIDKVCWVGTDRRIYITDPNPTEVSDFGMVERLKGVTDPTLLYATTATDSGHDFYIVHLTDGLGSWALDLQTRCWSEWESNGKANFRGAVSTLLPNNATVLGDDTSNVLWELTTDERLDGADVMIQEFPGLLAVPGAPTRCNNVVLGVTTGLNPDPDADPMMSMEMSDDQGETWTDPKPQPLGRQGQRVNRVMWPRLGMLRRPGRLFRFSTTEPVTIQTAKYNESYR